MATYTPTSKVIGSTGATGGNGFTGLVAAQNTAVAAAVTTALGITGVTPNGITISPAQLVNDTGSAFLEMIQTLTYTVLS